MGWHFAALSELVAHLERQLNANLRLDVSYIANRGTRLTADWQKMGVAANMNPSSVLSIPNATLKLNCSLVNSAAGLCAGGVSALRHLQWQRGAGSEKNPHYQNVLWRDVPLGSSMYNALEVVLEQRYSHGLGFRVGYTYSRLITMDRKPDRAAMAPMAPSRTHPVRTNANGVWSVMTPARVSRGASLGKYPLARGSPRVPDGSC